MDLSMKTWRDTYTAYTQQLDLHMLNSCENNMALQSPQPGTSYYFVCQGHFADTCSF